MLGTPSAGSVIQPTEVQFLVSGASNVADTFMGVLAAAPSTILPQTLYGTATVSGVELSTTTVSVNPADLLTGGGLLVEYWARLACCGFGTCVQVFQQRHACSDRTPHPGSCVNASVPSSAPPSFSSAAVTMLLVAALGMAAMLLS